ncbi:MAG: GNAT family N-acetyltransferase [Syntrophomonadaceae bacterium]|nr:GNAT family N-acetyltransferase [Syntrophomonadaceae bacterium]
MEIRQATESDLPAIVEIYNQAIAGGVSTADLEPYTVETRRPWFENHDPQRYPIFVAIEGGAVIGWLSFSSYRGERKALRRVTEISYYLHDDWQGRGVGSQLLAFAIEEAPRWNFRVLVAMLLSGNERSIRLLEKTGFQLWGVLPRLSDMGDRYCDHLYYGLHLEG